jgi:hypothetical protein
MPPGVPRHLNPSSIDELTWMLVGIAGGDVLEREQLLRFSAASTIQEPA